MRQRQVKIAGRDIGDGQEPFVIAEMSGNHNGSLDRALEIVEAAAASGADALKLQTYTADTMTLDLDSGEFYLDHPGSLWRGYTLHRLYQEAATPWEWHAPIFKRCRELGLIPLSSPFDATAVDFLETLDCPAYKIASPENIDLPLIRKAAATGKPLIISTGMATLAELDEAVSAARAAGCDQLVLLKCVTSYPAAPEQCNLRSIPALAEIFNLPVGLSDHSLGIGVSLAGVALGAAVVEKHFTLRRVDGGPDAVFSIEPAELKELATEAWRVHLSLGEPFFGPTDDEKVSRKTRRSLYVALDMKAGEAFTPENLRSIRPGLGLPPKHYDDLLGKRVARDVKKGTPTSWDLIG